MSRSRKKASIGGITSAASEKKDKRVANKSLRRVTKTTMQKRTSDELVLPTLREVSDVWGMAKDGKQFFDAKTHPKLMRK